MKRLAGGLAIVLLIAGAGLVVYVSPFSRSSSEPGEQPRAGTGPARILLNEIQFLPGSNQPPWIEIVNAGGATGTLDGLVLDNHDGQTFVLPDRLTLRTGTVIVVRFDGQTGADATTVHAPATFLAPNGAAHLRSAQGPLDRIAWGDGQTGAANLSRGGFDAGLAPGSTLGRVPGTTGTDPLEWVSYAPDQATPGMANQQPAVEVMMPMDGAIVSAATVDLAWYTVPATARYRLQIASEPSFASPLLDRTVDAPPVTTPALAPGSYLWRVQAIGLNGSVAGYSMPNALIVRAARPRAVRNESLFERLFPVLHAAARQPGSIDNVLPTVLDVPLIHQHKDTRMLLLESPREGAGRSGHAWDEDHGEFASWDAADSMNAAPASLAMLVQYYKQRFNYPGRLSQDRINYEVFHAESAGPEGDLNWGRSYNRARLTKAMAFAFGVPPSIDPVDDDELWIAALWGARIEAGMPGIACKNRHCVAIVGAGTNAGMLVINDPGSRGTYLAPFRVLRGATVFVMARPDGVNASVDPIVVRPRSDEAGIAADSDGDGVVDFDELNRFHTNPKSKDTDHDELPDKQDIRASVHDPRHGFAHGGTGRDFDGDGKPMELDADADGGGCLDGWEDENKNGRFEPGPAERDNFAKDDDGCISGSHRFVHDSFWTHPTNGDTQKLDALTEIQFSLREAGGSHRGRATVTYMDRQAVTRPQPAPCQNWVNTTDPYEYVVEVHANTVAMPDGTLAVSIGTPAGWEPPKVRVVSSCPTSTPFEQPGPGVGLGGFLRNGVFDERVDMPLDLEGATGRKFYETHIRIGSGRR
jgi:hypothetical protein